MKRDKKSFESFCHDWLDSWSGNKKEISPYFSKLLANNPDWIWTTKEIIPTGKGFTLKWHAQFSVNESIHEEEGLDIVELNAENKIVRNEVYFDRAGLLKLMREG